jgi:thiamine biosynthesis protein ThiS
MQITLNGQNQTVQDGQTIADLIEAQGLAGQPCAVEVNRKLVPKREHAQHTLAEGDTVELVTLVGGG